MENIIHNLLDSPSFNGIGKVNNTLMVTENPKEAGFTRETITLKNKMVYDEDAEIVYSPEFKSIVNPVTISSEDTRFVHKPFIEANTTRVKLSHLSSDCIIPVFSKDNEKTIAHQEFINTVVEAVREVYPNHILTEPEIRVSHQIKGRTPEAIHKDAKDLLDNEKTIYYERMAFIVQLPSITATVNGNQLALTVGGVRSYSLENLYNKKSVEKFKFFIGFQNKVCCNLCVTSDGFVDDMRVFSLQELKGTVLKVLNQYNAVNHIEDMKKLTTSSLTEHQFAQLLGKVRLYQHLPKSDKQKLGLPMVSFNDSQFNTMAKDYYSDNSFSKDAEGNINLWKVFNLFTQANKSSYIDTFLDRNLNAFEFTHGLQRTLNGDSSYHWFLS